MPPSESGSPNAGRLRFSVIAPVLMAFVGLSVMAALISHSIHASSQKRQEAKATENGIGSSGGNAIGQQSATGVTLESSAKPSLESPAVTASRSETVGGVPRPTPYLPVEHVSDLDDLMSSSRPEPEKLGVALVSLESSDKKIRSAALDAVKGLDDRDAVPRLQELAARMEDSDEKTASLDTAEFLNLPSFTEDAAGQPAAAPVQKTTAAERLAGVLPRHKNAAPAGN